MQVGNVIRIVSLCVCLCAVVASFNDKIISLPGYHGPALNQSSGYVTVDQKNGRKLFYWLIESQGQPESDPLVVWYQGGPGCSGLLGLMEEHGPFRVTDAGLEYNPSTWAKIANMLYLEAPAGVGFSYSNTPSDYNTNDQKTAQDNYQFLQTFLKLYPQYVGRDLWLTGESYAGVYIPTVAKLIVEGPSKELRSALKGLMLGNPHIACDSINRLSTQFQTYYWHGLISYTNYYNWTTHGCDKINDSYCLDIFNRAQSQIGVIYQQLVEDDNFPSLDPDNLFQDFCTGNASLELTTHSENPLACTSLGSRTVTYMNRKDVKAAIHVETNVTWTPCSYEKINYTKQGGSMIPFYQEFFVRMPQLKILFYSGDLDVGTVVTGLTAGCLAELKGKIIDDWSPWFVNRATAGYVQQFDTYTFATVKGAGHTVPLYQPISSFALFQRFLTSGKLKIPSSKPKSQSFHFPL